MKGFVLAAGFGQRLSPLTNTIPKPLFPVGNVPLIGYALRLLAYHGITEVIVNLHHLGKSIREALRDGAAYGVHITYSEEPEILGTGGGLKKVHELLEDDTFVVVNSDTIIDIDLGAVIEAHRRNDALATMVLREEPGQGEYGHIEIDEAGRIRRILGHGGEGLSLRSYMFTGVHVLEPRFLEYIPPDVSTCVVRYAYTKALNNDEPLFGFTFDGPWLDAGTPAHYFDANVAALEQRLTLRHVDPLGGFVLSPRRNVAEVVRIGRDVELGDNVQLLPPVLLGDDARIGDDTTVGPYAVVGPRVHVGKDAQLSHCVLLEGARVESDARLRRMIVGRKASIALDEP